MKTTIIKKVLPLIVVALVGMALATSCEKEKNKEKVESYTYQYDGVNYVNLTIYWHQGKYYTEVTNNLKHVKFLFNDNTWEQFRLNNDMMYVKETYSDGVNPPIEGECVWEYHFISDTVLQMKYGNSLPDDASQNYITTYDFVKRKDLNK